MKQIVERLALMTGSGSRSKSRKSIPLHVSAQAGQLKIGIRRDFSALFNTAYAETGMIVVDAVALVDLLSQAAEDFALTFEAGKLVVTDDLGKSRLYALDVPSLVPDVDHPKEADLIVDARELGAALRLAGSFLRPGTTYLFDGAVLCIRDGQLIVLGFDGYWMARSTLKFEGQLTQPLVIPRESGLDKLGTLLMSYTGQSARLKREGRGLLIALGDDLLVVEVNLLNEESIRLVDLLPKRGQVIEVNYRELARAVKRIPAPVVHLEVNEGLLLLSGSINDTLTRVELPTSFSDPFRFKVNRSYLLKALEREAQLVTSEQPAIIYIESDSAVIAIAGMS